MHLAQRHGQLLIELVRENRLQLGFRVRTAEIILRNEAVGPMFRFRNDANDGADFEIRRRNLSAGRIARPDRCPRGPSRGSKITASSICTLSSPGPLFPWIS